MGQSKCDTGRNVSLIRGYFDTRGRGLVASKALRILKGIKIIPHGVQQGLKPVKLYGELEVDPRRDDLAVKFVEFAGFLENQTAEIGKRYLAANPNQKAQRNETVALLAWK